MIGDVPVLKVQLEGMRYQVMHAMMDHQEEISAAVEDALTQELADVDISSIVKGYLPGLIRDVVHKTIDSYFKYGEGQRVIAQYVGEALGDAVKRFNGETQ